MTIGHATTDPESLLTGAEVEAGFTYKNSHRSWATETAKRKALAGDLTEQEILELGPRKFNSRPAERGFYDGSFCRE
jgi:hypothetical protein